MHRWQVLENDTYLGTSGAKLIIAIQRGKETSVVGASVPGMARERDV